MDDHTPNPAVSQSACRSLVEIAREVFAEDLAEDLAAPLEGPTPYSIGPSLYKEEGSAFKLLSARVDTLYLNVVLKPEVLEAWLDHLAGWKLLAQDCKEGIYRLVGDDLPGQADRFFVRGKGLFKKPYWITDPDIGDIVVGQNELFAPVRLRLFSTYIATCTGFAGVVAGGLRLVEDFFGAGTVEKIQISELHLAADFTGVLFRVADLQQQRFTCGASPHLEDQDEAFDVAHSLRWGSHGSPMSAVIYNKVREILGQSPEKAYLFDDWKSEGWDGDAAVYRLEFRFKREWLRDRSIETFEDVDLAALFTAGMEWLKFHTVNPDDSNNRRWPVAPEWVRLQADALALLGQVWKVYAPERVPRVTVGQLVAQVGGCVACIGALVGSVDLYKLADRVIEIFRRELSADGADFAELVAARRDRYMLPSLSAVAA